MMRGARFTAVAMVALLALAVPGLAHAELVLSELIVELRPGAQVRADIEVWNNSPERSFVSIEPREIVDPSLVTQSVRREPDPEKLGLLVSPARMILEPGQRKLVRVASLRADPDREHVYRVTVKPVVGGLEAADSGLKIILGYDVLVLVRPTRVAPAVAAVRKGKSLIFTNAGNVSVELVDGRQCSTRSQCVPLPGKRLYAGASWTTELPLDAPAEYTLKSPGRNDRKTY